MRAKEFILEKRRRKKRSRSRGAAYGPGPYGVYGYYTGYSGDSGVEGVAEGLSWSALDEGLSIENKMAIFEEYAIRGYLPESIDQGRKKK